MVHSPLTADLTITSLLPPLVAGGEVHIVGHGDGVEPLVQGLLRQDGPVLLKLTPSHLELLTADLGQEARGRVGTLVVGGERLLEHHVRAWRRLDPATVVINLYGPTEATVGCCTHLVGAEPQGNPIPIGRPIANTRLYVLDEHLQPQPGRGAR